MAKDPAVLFYTSDFLTGTLTMTYEQKGKYITLLCLQHQKGVLSEKDMLSICLSYDEDVFSKFKKEGENYYNERMKLEHEKRSSYSKSRSNNRLKGLVIKEKKPKKKPLSYVNHMENVNENVIIDYFISNGYSKELAQKFYLHYQPDWKDSNGKVVKDWKKKAKVVWFKEENKQVLKYNASDPRTFRN